MATDERKRRVFERRLRPVLEELLNDPTVMPNLDCPHILVSVTALEFGPTVRTIYFDVWGERRDASVVHDVTYYEEIARKLGRDPPWYDDLTDVMAFEKFDTLEQELQRRLRLPYRPTLKSLGNALYDQGMANVRPLQRVELRDREELRSLDPVMEVLSRYVSDLRLGSDTPSHQEIREQLEEVLLGRKDVWLCYREGLIASEEAANKVLAEIESWAFAKARAHYSGTPDPDKAIEVVTEMRRVLFEQGS